MSYKISYLLYIIAFITGAILLTLSIFLRSTWFVACGISLIILGFIQTLFFLRCPKCKRILNWRGGRPGLCPNCKHELNW